jgi:Ala-tRNA(Pro) deacylase
MPVARGLRDYLKGHRIKFKALRCPTNYSAQQLAHAKHMSGYDVAKVVVLKSGNQFELGVIPACYRISFSKVKKLTGQSDLQLATEAEIKTLFPDCELGAMPPFGNIYHLPVYVDAAFNPKQTITFAAGSHTNAIQMRYKDFSKWVKPKVGKIADPMG